MYIYLCLCVCLCVGEKIKARLNIKNVENLIYFNLCSEVVVIE